MAIDINAAKDAYFAKQLRKAIIDNLTVEIGAGGGYLTVRLVWDDGDFRKITISEDSIPVSEIDRRD